MYDQHNVNATAKDNSGQNAGKGHTRSPTTEIKISNSAENRTQTDGFERQGSYRPRHGDGLNNLIRNINIILQSNSQSSDNYYN